MKLLINRTSVCVGGACQCGTLGGQCPVDTLCVDSVDDYCECQDSGNIEKDRCLLNETCNTTTGECRCGASNDYCGWEPVLVILPSTYDWLWVGSCVHDTSSDQDECRPTIRPPLRRIRAIWMAALNAVHAFQMKNVMTSTRTLRKNLHADADQAAHRPMRITVLDTRGVFMILPIASVVVSRPRSRVTQACPMDAIRASVFVAHGPMNVKVRNNAREATAHAAQLYAVWTRRMIAMELVAFAARGPANVQAPRRAILWPTAESETANAVAQPAPKIDRTPVAAQHVFVPAGSTANAWAP
jgi:hypothetical protein